LIKEGRCEAQEDLGKNVLTIKHVEEEFPHKNVKDIVKGLQKEGLIMIKK